MRKALIALLVTAAWGAGSAQTKINPTTQINWPLITGAGTPTSLSIACSSTNYGQPFQNTAVTPNTYYTCGTDGWAVRGGSDSNAVTMASPFTGIYSIPISAGTGRAQVDSGLEFDTSMDQLEFRGGPFNINNVVIHDAVLDGSAISNTSIGSSSPAQGTFTQIDLAPTGTATSSANFPSSIIQFDSSQWNGSIPVALQWKAQSVPSPSSGVGTFDMLKFSHGGSLASYGISIPSLYLTNLTSGNCLQATTGGQVVDTGTPCGSSGGGISALTGDVTASGSGSVPATLATVSSTFGSCGDATHVCQITTNAKGLTTSQTAVAVTAGAAFPSSPSSALFTYTSTTAGRASTAADIGAVLKVVESPSYATIELAVAACGGTFPCQINLSSALTQSTSGTYTPPSGVVIVGQAGGSITPGSGNTLDFSNITFSGPPVAFFTGAGTITGMSGTVDVEWFGATRYASRTAAIAAADDSSHFQAGLNSITRGGYLTLQCAYYRSDHVSITVGGVWIRGSCPGYSAPSASTPSSVIVSNSASADIVAFAGTSSTYIFWNGMERVALERSIVPVGTAGTASGVSANYVQFTAGSFTNVISTDSICNFYFHGANSASLHDSFGGWGFGAVSPSSYGALNLGGICYDSSDGIPSDSTDTNNTNISSNLPNSSAATTTGVKIYGTHINDNDEYFLSTASTSYGATVVYTGSGGVDEAADIHFVSPTMDECLVSCFYISGLSSGGSGSMFVSNGYLDISGFMTGARIVDIENSSGISITGNQMFNIVSGAAQIGIYANASNFLTLSNNLFQNLEVSTGIQLNATTGSSVTGNTFLGTSSFVMTNAISLTSASTGNSISGNAASGNITTAYIFDGTSLANDFGLNSCSGGSIGTCESGVPTGTAPSFLGAGSRVNGVTLSSTGSASLFLTQAGTYASASGSTGISGGTATYAAIFGSATTITSGIPINGAGAGLVTGPSAPTSGDVAFFTGGAGAITDGLIAGANLVTAASALTANQIVLGAGSKTTAGLGSLGTTTTVLHGNASGAPSFGAVALSTDVTGTLPPGNFVVATTCPTCGITGSPLSQFASTTSAQLAGVLSDETGTGSAVFATSPTLVTPALGTPASGVITNLTGTCAACSIGGNAATATSTTTATNLSGGVLGSTPYQTAASTTAFVAPNTSATKEFYSMTGTGSAGASPAWGVLLAADIPTITLAQVSAGTVVGSGGTFAFGTNTVSIGTALTNTNFRSPNGTTNQNFGVMSGGNWTASAPFFLINPPVVSSSLAGTPSQFSTTGTFSNTGTSTGSWTGMVLNNTFGAGTSNVYNGSAPIEQLNLTPTINVATTSTNGYVGLMMNVTETSISAGATNYLARLQVGGADRFTVTNAGFANAVQLNSTLGSGTVTATPATGVTSVTCQTATCNVNGGTYTVVGGTATTGTFTTFTWPTTTTAWRCTTSMNGGGTFLGLGHSVATATGMTVSSAVTILSTTFTFDYSCQP